MFCRIGSSISRAHATRGVLAGVTILAVATSLLVTGVDRASAAISGAGTFTYEQGDPALDIGGGITVADGTSYGGQFLEFAVNSSTATETLSLASVVSADTTSGVVSIVGGDVFLGNGVSADQIGSIDATNDGGAGRTLRVDFADEFVNPGFEDGLIGWTPMNQRINLGTDNIAGCATVDTSTYPAPSTNDDNPPFDGGVPIVTVETTGSPTEGTHAAQLRADPMFVGANGDVVHGPAIFSSAFELDAGAKIAFDWRGLAGIDDYHVFGYLLGSTCNQIEVLDATSPTTSAWTTSETTIIVADTYRIVFVNGTFDGSTGAAAGASLLVDNIRAEGPKVTDDVVQQIARKLQYFNSSFSAAMSRTVGITAQSALAGTLTGSITVNLVMAPIISPPTTGPPGGSGSDAGYLGLVPSRLWDSRNEVKPVAASVRELVVRGLGGVPSDATAVVLNVTVDQPEGWGFVTVFPCGGFLPLASNVNFVAGQTVANAVTVAVGGDGEVCVYASIATHLIVDVNGAFSPGQGTGLLVAGLVPSRLWDSRNDVKPVAASVRELVVRGQGGVPSDATAVVLNVTVDQPQGTGFVTVFPCGGALPLASNVNYVAGLTVANAVIVAVGVVGRVCVYTSAPSHLIVDVNGAFSPGQGTGLLVGGVGPSRLSDSRGGLKPTATSLLELVVRGQGGVPSNATAVVLNVTVDGPEGTGFVTVFPCGGALPLASNVNYVAGQTVANAVTVTVGVLGRVCIYTSAASHLIVDTNGAFAP